MEKQREPIAIVGIGCRFPGSNGPEGFWRTLCEGKDTIGPIPKNRWDADAFFDPDPTKRGKMVARTGGFLDDIEGFDWRAFRVSPREAKFMDPQHRLMLEVAWEAFEDAGVPFEKLAGSRTAVFVGIMWNDYGKLQALDLEGLDGYSASGNAFAFAANRVSFFFDLKGPSVALDVSCASSLIAVHLACESIWSGESVMAVAGGVNLIIAPDSVIAMSKAGILSSEGHCKPFDASADGFVRGEGAGAVILKPLSAALADGDRIHAVIRGTAAMHSGKTDWIMAPSSAAQEDVYRTAYQRAGVDPRDVDYVELHGTGTRKGDPLEAKSVSKVMGAGSGRQGRCVVGSVKTNLGHLDSAAGIAGLVKTALALEHRRIPGSLNLKNVNPEIDLDALGLDFRTELGPWPAKDGRAIAGVTGLSFGGGNVHIVLEEPPRPATEAASPETTADSFVLPLSARSEGALRELAGQYQALLRDGASPQPLCAAASLNRSHHSQRIAVTGRTASELEAALRRWVDASAEQGATRATSHAAPVFVFSGQGPQWWGMGRELAEREPVFRDVLERCDAAVRRHASFSILDELAKDEASSRVQETQVAQPVIFALQAALARLLEAWGVKPGAVVGHSVGEIAAAYVSGAVTLETAARIAASRGRIMHAASHLGRMVQVNLSREEAAALIEPFGARLCVGAENGPRSVVLSGETDAVQSALQLVKDRGASARLLPVRYAFHSAVMNRFQGELVRALEGVEPRDPVIPLVSTLLGRSPNPGEAFTPDYWARQMREPVEFFRAISSLSRDGHGTFIEIGPHPVLGRAIGECLGDARDGACVLPTLVRDEPERLSILSTLAALYSRGQDVAWPAVVGKRAWAPLPTYPWQREKMWIERRRVPSPAPAPVAAANAGTSRAHPLLQVSSKLARPSNACIWEAVLDVERMPYLRDHRVGGRVVVPASLFVEMAIAASADEADTKRLTLRDVDLLRALILPDHGAVRLQLFSSIDDSGTTRLEIWSKPENEPQASWTLHVTAVVDAPKGSLLPSVLPSAKGSEAIAGADVYAAFRRSGEDYGAAFQGIQRLWREAPSSVLAELSAPRVISTDVDRYYFHPALLDACMHCMAAARTHDGEAGFMPTHIDRIEVVGRAGARLWARATMRDSGDGASGTTEASIRVFDDRGGMLLDIHGISLQYLDDLGRGETRSALDMSSCYEVAWRATDVPMSTESPGRFAIVSGGGDLTSALCRSLEQNGHAVTVGESFDSVGDCHAIVFVPDDDSRDHAAPPSTAATMRLIETVRAMTALPSGVEPRLFVVTRDGQRVANETVEPSQGLFWGLGRSIAAEYPSLWGGLIDVSTSEDVERMASSITSILTARTTEDQIAVRAGTYLAARLVPLSEPSVSTELSIDRDAAYLVTGGFGALGQTFARDLLARGAQHVILMSRSGPSVEHAATLGKLSGLGGTVYHAIADVADEAQVRSALDKLRRDGVPEVRGVLHAAGTVLLQPITELEERDVHALFRSKVTGSWVLDRVFAASDLGFFVLFSSASAVLQSASLSAYAAANAYQDALAHARRARGQRALTVNWGPWAGEGMAKDTGAGRGPLGLRGMGAIDGAQGTRLLARFLELDVGQVSVLPIDWATFRAAYPSFDRSPFLSELGASAAGDENDEPRLAPVRSILQTDGGKITRERIEQYLLDSAARALHASPEALSAESTLIELGLDSLMLVELRLEIERALGVRLRLMDLLSDPTIRELSKNLEPHVKEVA